MSLTKDNSGNPVLVPWIVGTPTNGQVVAYNGTTDRYEPSTPATGAPADAQYVTLATNGTLTNERVLTAGTNVTLTDGGAGSTVTVASSISLWDWNRTDVSQFTLYNNASASSISFDTSATVGGRPKIKLTTTGTDKGLVFVTGLSLPRRYRMRLSIAFSVATANFTAGPLFGAYDGGTFAASVGHWLDWPSSSTNANAIRIIEGTNVAVDFWTGTGAITFNGAPPSAINGKMNDIIIDYEAESTTVNSTVDNVRICWTTRDDGTTIKGGRFERSGSYTGATWNNKTLTGAGLCFNASTSGTMAIEDFRIERHPLDT